MGVAPVSALVSGVVLGQPMGGVRRHNQELLPRLARLIAADGGRLAVLEGAEPVAFALPPEVERIASDVPARPLLVRSALEGRALERAVRAAEERGQPFDLIHLAHLPVPRRLSLPFALTLHDLRSLELEHTPFSRRFVAKQVIGSAVGAARVVVAVSETVRASLIERFGLDPERVRVVPNAADHFDPMPRRPPPDAPILCIGHLEPRKNLEVLLRALASATDLPRLALAGASKGDHADRLRALAEELGVAGRVTFLGAFDDARLPELYAGAACAVLPSRLEGFGIPALEAQRARVPLAIARAGALVEVAGEETPSFAPDDPEECAAAIRRALDATADDIERAARRAARYRWDDSARAWLAAWRDAAG